ncbi:hypothetical protein BDV98DRAFT_91334 [Pterulicium gracile]|uniref:FHA domain-containing protein n=1 Tax=Pterulicium gracile TaxID=1884261 RepID=A0A5C3QS23_9AGAR|nr:hypothetical protein BDV98DRAFT_91334 [Pterula gracilis]
MNNNEGGDSSSSPPLRSNILSSFLRARPRAAQLPSINTDPDLPAASGAVPHPTSPGAAQPHHRHPSPNSNHHHSSSNIPASASTNNNNNNNNNMSNGGTGPQGLSQILRRRRSANNVGGATPSAPTPTAPLPISTHPSGASLTTALPTPTVSTPGLTTPPAVIGGPPIHRIRLVPQLESRRSLRFDPITRTVKSGDPVLRIGRFTDRSGQGLASLANATSSSKLAFRSKVVSRAHAEIWVDQEGKFWIKDTKSSSGTFLNHVRLSLAGQESRGFVVRDGDVVQLGVDYQGGTEDIYKCVKIRVEIGRDWQRAPNTFNTNAMKNLKAIAVLQDGGPKVKEAAAKAGNGKVVGLGLPDCCICEWFPTFHHLCLCVFRLGLVLFGFIFICGRFILLVLRSSCLSPSHPFPIVAAIFLSRSLLSSFLLSPSVLSSSKVDSI